MNTAFILDKTLCTGCGACMVACMDQNDINTGKGESAFRGMRMEETPCGWEIKAFGCMHCMDAACIEACPQNCFHRDPDTNLVILDATQCVGCEACEEACHYNALRHGIDGRMVKCNGCNERVKAGLKPACVKICQMQALRLANKGK